MSKMTKFVKKWKKERWKVFQVIHTKPSEKSGKTLGFWKFSKLSTQKHMFSVENLDKKSKRMFWEEFIKIWFCRKKTKKVLTFQMSKNDRNWMKVAKNSEYLKFWYCKKYKV